MLKSLIITAVFLGVGASYVSAAPAEQSCRRTITISETVKKHKVNVVYTFHGAKIFSNSIHRDRLVCNYNLPSSSKHAAGLTLVAGDKCHFVVNPKAKTCASGDCSFICEKSK